MASKKRRKRTQKHEKPRKKKPVSPRKRATKPSAKAKARKHKVSRAKNARPRKVTPRKPRKVPPRSKPKTKRRRTKRSAKERALREEVRKLKARLDVAEKTEGFVHAHDIEYLRRNGTIAKNPSIHRHRFTDSQFKKLRKELKIAIGAHDHNRLARISAIFEIPLRELYTLFFSP